MNYMSLYAMTPKLEEMENLISETKHLAGNTVVSRDLQSSLQIKNPENPDNLKYSSDVSSEQVGKRNNLEYLSHGNSCLPVTSSYRKLSANSTFQNEKKTSLRSLYPQASIFGNGVLNKNLKWNVPPIANERLTSGDKTQKLIHQSAISERQAVSINLEYETTPRPASSAATETEFNSSTVMDSGASFENHGNCYSTEPKNMNQNLLETAQMQENPGVRTYEGIIGNAHAPIYSRTVVPPGPYLPHGSIIYNGIPGPPMTIGTGPDFGFPGFRDGIRVPGAPFVEFPHSMLTNRAYGSYAIHQHPAGMIFPGHTSYGNPVSVPGTILYGVEALPAAGTLSRFGATHDVAPIPGDMHAPGICTTCAGTGLRIGKISTPTFQAPESTRTNGSPLLGELEQSRETVSSGQSRRILLPSNGISKIIEETTYQNTREPFEVSTMNELDTYSTNQNISSLNIPDWRSRRLSYENHLSSSFQSSKALKEVIERSLVTCVSSPDTAVKKSGIWIAGENEKICNVPPSSKNSRSNLNSISDTLKNYAMCKYSTKNISEAVVLISEGTQTTGLSLNLPLGDKIIQNSGEESPGFQYFEEMRTFGLQDVPDIASNGPKMIPEVANFGPPVHWSYVLRTRSLPAISVSPRIPDTLALNQNVGIKGPYGCYVRNIGELGFRESTKLEDPPRFRNTPSTSSSKEKIVSLGAPEQSTGNCPDGPHGIDNAIHRGPRNSLGMDKSSSPSVTVVWQGNDNSTVTEIPTISVRSRMNERPRNCRKSESSISSESSVEIHNDEMVKLTSIPESNSCLTGRFAKKNEHELEIQEKNQSSYKQSVSKKMQVPRNSRDSSNTQASYTFPRVSTYPEHSQKFRPSTIGGIQQNSKILTQRDNGPKKRTSTPTKEAPKTRISTRQYAHNTDKAFSNPDWFVARKTAANLVVLPLPHDYTFSHHPTVRETGIENNHNVTRNYVKQMKCLKNRGNLRYPRVCDVRRELHDNRTMVNPRIRVSSPTCEPSKQKLGPRCFGALSKGPSLMPGARCSTRSTKSRGSGRVPTKKRSSVRTQKLYVVCTSAHKGMHSGSSEEDCPCELDYSSEETETTPENSETTTRNEKNNRWKH